MLKDKDCQNLHWCSIRTCSLLSAARLTSCSSWLYNVCTCAGNVWSARGSDLPPKTTATWVLKMPVLAYQAPKKLLAESIHRTIPIARSSVSVFLNGFVVPVICNPQTSKVRRAFRAIPNHRLMRLC